ncbi:MAG: carbon storage regulator CsrA [Desulfobaccales bacterium]
MLILTRKIGESIIVGENIRVVVLEVRGRQIRLGIEAPADIVVLREEIFNRLINENLEAAKFNPEDVEPAGKVLEDTVARRSALRPTRPGSPCVSVESKILGRLQVPENQIVSFVSGLPGFPDYQRYALLPDLPRSLFSYLQCLEDPSLAFIVTDPNTLVPDYRLKNCSNAMKELRAESPEDLQVLVTLTIPPGRPREMTANMMSPLLVNPDQGLGKQVVIEKPQYSHQHPVLAARPGGDDFLPREAWTAG